MPDSDSFYYLEGNTVVRFWPRTLCRFKTVARGTTPEATEAAARLLGAYPSQAAMKRDLEEKQKERFRKVIEEKQQKVRDDRRAEVVAVLQDFYRQVKESKQVLREENPELVLEFVLSRLK